MGKSAGSPPPAPDYKGAAEATAASNRYNQNTPYGNLTWSSSPGSDGNPQWTSSISLDPRVQSALDQQLDFSTQMGNLGQQQLGQVQAQGQPDLSSVQGVADKAYGAMTSRLDPQWEQREGSFQNQMANQGIPVGSEAYENANREFQQGRNDAYQQANLGAIQTMPQTYQMATDQYNQPLNRFNAFRTGTQVNSPQFQQPGGGANLLGAAQAQGQYGQGLYNAEVGSANSANSGMAQVGSAALMAFAI